MTGSKPCPPFLIDWMPFIDWSKSPPSITFLVLMSWIASFWITAFEDAGADICISVKSSAYN